MSGDDTDQRVRYVSEDRLKEIVAGFTGLIVCSPTDLLGPAETLAIATELAASRSPSPLTPAMLDVLAERRRQVEAEAFDEAHDDEHIRHEIAAAGAAYAFAASIPDYDRPQLNQPGSHLRWLLSRIWPGSWDIDRWFKLKSRRQDLVRAAALIIAAIERLDRQDAKEN